MLLEKKSSIGKSGGFNSMPFYIFMQTSSIFGMSSVRLNIIVTVPKRYVTGCHMTAPCCL